jgi:uncharacterized membrane protein YdjX (TVP38/TMEM64 family)
MIVLVLTVAALGAAAFLLPLHAIPAAVQQLGPLAPVAGVVVGAALLVALVPRTPISIACGLLFGTVIGAVCALALAVVAATVTFVVGRVLGREFVIRKAGRRWHRLERWIAREGVLAVAAVRAFPLGPYGLVGYAYGASNVRVRDYTLGSILAGTPSAVTYAMLGAAIGGAGAASPLTLVPLATALVLAAVVAARTRRHALVRESLEPRPAS